MRSLVVLGIGVAVLALGWRIDWERKHPAAPAARKIRQGDSAARIQALHELEGLGRVDPEIAIPALVVGLGDPDAALRAASAMALVSPATSAGSVESAHRVVRDAVDALSRSSKDERADVRAAVVQSLWMITITWSGPAETIDRSGVLDVLLEAVGDRDTGVRLAGLRGIGTVGPQIIDAPPPVLLAAMEDEAEQIRAAAAMALVHFRRGLPQLVPDLLRALESARPEIRPSYREVLGAIQAPRFSAEAVPALMAILGGADAETRSLAAWSLTTYKDGACAAIPALIRSLDDSRGINPIAPESARPSSAELMAMAMASTFEFGDPPMESAPSSRDPVIEAANALGRLAPPTDRSGAAIVALAKVLQGGSVWRRVVAAKALGRFPRYDFKRGSNPADRADPHQIAALTAAIGDAKLPVRVAALRVLHDVGMKTRFDAPPELNTAIAQALEDPSPEIRTRAAAAVAHYGDVADRFFPALIRHAAHDPDEEVRDMCCSAITLDSGPLPARVTPAIIPILIEALASRERDLRRAACRLLGRLAPGTPQAAAAISRLRELAKLPDLEMSDAARKALGEIEKSP